MSRWKILAATTALAVMVLATTASLPACARELQPLAPATPEQVGMSPERLGRITSMLKKEIADGKLPGAVVMTICFAAILSAVVEERVDAKAGAMLLRPLLAIGIFSLLLWRWTDDLRLYAWAQFSPFIALALILRLFPPKYTGTSYWVIAAALYALAKLLEFLDEKIFSLGSIVSGHTLKHLAAAAASLAILRLLQTRRPIAP